MARCLLIGCGCRGLELGRVLIAGGHAVRGTTRQTDRLGQLELAGIEGVLGDPDRVATLTGAFEHVTLACVLLGSAVGASEAVSRLHSSRLRMLLERMLDTTVRGIAYEARGSVPGTVLEAGAEIVAAACAGSQIPYALLRADPTDHERWIAEAGAAVEGLLEG